MSAKSAKKTKKLGTLCVLRGSNRNHVQKIFLSADHGMAIIYFLQSDLVLTQPENGAEIGLLTEDETRGTS